MQIRSKLALASVLVGAFVATASAQKADIFNPADPVVSVAPASLPARGAPVSLYNNGPFVTGVGTGTGGADLSTLQNPSLGMLTIGFGIQSTAGNRIADQFVVPAGTSWRVDEAAFYNYQTGSTSAASTINGVNIRIWNGPPNNPASTVVFGDTTTNRFVSSTWSGAFRVTETTLTDTTRPIMTTRGNLGATVLAAGTYWLDWSMTGTLASGPWQPPITITGTAVTGDALQFLGTSSTWAAALDTGTGTPAQGVPFTIFGAVLQGTLAVAPAPVEFGSITLGSTGNQTVTLSNTGSASLSISAITAAAAPFATAAGGTCTALPIVLAPAATCTLNYTFSPTAQGPATQTLTVTSNGTGATAITLQGTGSGAGVVGVSSSTLTFGNQTVGGGSNQVLTVTNTGNAPLSINSLSTLVAPFSVVSSTCSPLPFTLDPGYSCTITVRFAPAAAGPATSSLVLTTSLGTTTVALAGVGVVAIPLPAQDSWSRFGLLLLIAGVAGMTLRRRA